MNLAGKHIVVTGGANGIGAALCRRFHAEGARAIVVSDIEGDKAAAVASEVGGFAIQTNVAKETDIQALVASAEILNGPIDLFCSNAGIFTPGGIETPDAEWHKIWEINFLAHLYAARAVIPGMIARGGGYILATASAAGLLSQPGSASYAVTKHAAVAFAEWLSMTHGDQGIKVSCLCPQGVRTRMLLGEDGEKESFLRKGSVPAEDVAEAVVQGLAAERFLILPHPEVQEYLQRKAHDHDRWLRGMRRLNAVVEGKP